ncbi:MAG: hypothetical protein R2845_05580 [Thermomicrobiales bacterium]
MARCADDLHRRTSRERIDDKENPVTQADVEQFGGYLRALTSGSERNPEFNFRYTEALQHDAGLLIAHNITMSTLPKPKPKTSPDARKPLALTKSPRQ